jgi:hypothetical protein
MSGNSPVFCSLFILTTGNSSKSFEQSKTNKIPRRSFGLFSPVTVLGILSVARSFGLFSKMLCSGLHAGCIFWKFRPVTVLGILSVAFGHGHGHGHGIFILATYPSQQAPSLRGVPLN